MSLVQLSLLQAFQPPAPALAPVGDPDGLRGYQREAIVAALADLDAEQETTIVLFTGAGKSRVGAAFVRAWPGRVLWLAMRDFLLDQARERIEQLCGVGTTTLEQGPNRADDSRIVVGSVQSMKGKRLAGYSRNYFSLICFDEVHHAAAESPRRIFAHFESAKRLGFTATPHRLDGKSGGFTRVAYRRDIGWGISEGYFCPIVPIRREIKSVDLTNIRTTVGDLNLGDLEKQIIKSAAPIARVAWEESLEGKLPTLVYTPGVASAKAVADTLNAYLPGSAVSVDGETPGPARRRVLEDFGKGTRFIVNCQIYTEGLDVPAAQCIVIARPTESLSLFLQMVGRGGRPEGWIGQLETRDERIAAIAASGKPSFRLVDIAGNAGKHSLATIVTAFGGELTPLERKHVDDVIRKRKRPDMTIDEALDEGKKAAAAELREVAERESKRIAEAAMSAEIKATRKTWNPFAKLGAGELDPDALTPEWTEQRPTPEQQAWMRKNKVSDKLSRGAVARLQRQSKEWHRLGLATLGQRRVLNRGRMPVDVPFVVASRLIDTLKRYRFHVNKALPELNLILSEGRQPGEEG